MRELKKINVKERVVSMLEVLPKKNREIIKRRFGMGSAAPETLESIGGSWGITRERVRQIQEYGMRKLKERGFQDNFQGTFSLIEDFISYNAGVVREEDLFGIAPEREKPYLSLTIRMMPNLLHFQETEELHARYALDRSQLNACDDFLINLHSRLREHGSPMKFLDLINFAKRGAPKQILSSRESLKEILPVSKLVQKGPFAYYGLREWASIRPRGVRDKAYLVFEREKRPLHFRELSAFIDSYFKETSFSRKTHPQTVHNELIKDPRFVLIGRGLYGLSDWGYEAGTVKDVLARVFKDKKRALTKEEALKFILKRRFVKPNTVFLNLQNKQYFKKLPNGKYYLV